MVRRYKEILCGFSLGLAMWVVDAAMHARLGEEIHSTGFVDELFNPGVTQLLFRVAFVVIATAFGWALWRANWRERELRALEDAVIAFHRQLDSPAMRIVSYARMLQGRADITRDERMRGVIEAIGEDARAIDALAQQYMRFSEQVMAGRTGEAIETLRAIESWTSAQSAARAASPLNQNSQQ